jgi:hypothetical protein
VAVLVTERGPRDDSHGVHMIIIATMAIGLFLFLLWLGMTVIRDSARNSALIALGLTVLFVFSVLRESSRPRRE